MDSSSEQEATSFAGKKLTKIQKAKHALQEAAEARAWLSEGRQFAVGLIGKVGPIIANPIAMYVIGNIVVHHLDEKHSGYLDEKSAADFKGGLAAVSLAWATGVGLGAVIPD